ncbi:MAG TPA: class I SAM-dependent methyltransferase [Thermoanaerobaculia bacterium]|nr:class I SAM-dependent methyltransferase [Thermoanaerobaculia bacterium]
MTLAFPSDPVSPFVAALMSELRREVPGMAGVDLSVDERDEMLGFLTSLHGGDRDRALFAYFQSGWSIARSMEQVLRWRFGSERPGRLLDFASGYGRVTRFLLRDLPPERVWVSDLYADAVRFQEERFGVHGLVSTVRPEDFACSERFDVILVTSLFTHLREDRFVAWLAALCRLLAPGGLLAWSVHDESVLTPPLQMPAGGIRFEAVSESGSIEGSDYGSAWVTEAFVRRSLEKVASGASVHRLERALCNYQDLYVAVLEPEVDFSGLAFRGEPQLFLEGAALPEPGVLEVWGWAALRGGSLREVQVVLDGEVLAAGPVAGPRPEVAAMLGAGPDLRPGWRLACPLPPALSRATGILMLRVVDDQGSPFPVWAGTAESLLLRSSRNEAGILERELARARDHIARLEPEAVRAGDLDARIAAMRASRFWKMRDAWFRVKRSLGLTDEE